MSAKFPFIVATLSTAFLFSPALPVNGQAADQPITGQAAFTDYTQEKPGIWRKITAKDLPEPYATKGVDNGADMVPRPQDAWPQAPQGFKVELYATGLGNPRLLRAAPNGDLFLADSGGNKIIVFR